MTLYRFTPNLKGNNSHSLLQILQHKIYKLHYIILFFLVLFYVVYNFGVITLFFYEVQENDTLPQT